MKRKKRTYEVTMTVQLAETFTVEAYSEHSAAAIALGIADCPEEWAGAERSSPEIERVEDITGLSKEDRALKALNAAGFRITKEMLLKAIEAVRREPDENV